MSNPWANSMTTARVTPGRAPSPMGGVCKTPSKTAKRLAALASARFSAVLSISASSAPASTASLRARTLSKKLSVLRLARGECSLRRTLAMMAVAEGWTIAFKGEAVISKVGRALGDGTSPRGPVPRVSVRRKEASLWAKPFASNVRDNARSKSPSPTGTSIPKNSAPAKRRAK